MAPGGGQPADPHTSPLWPYMKNVSFLGDPDATQIPNGGFFGYTDYGYDQQYIGGYQRINRTTELSVAVQLWARLSGVVSAIQPKPSCLPTRPIQTISSQLPCKSTPAPILLPRTIFGSDEYSETTHGLHGGGVANVCWLDGHAKSVKPNVVSTDALHKQLNLGYVEKTVSPPNDYYYGGPESQP